MVLNRREKQRFDARKILGGMDIESSPNFNIGGSKGY